MRYLDSKWKNRDNSLYYNTIGVVEYNRMAIKTGMSDWPDLNLLQNYILRARSILEVGAGYGRVVNYILRLGYMGELTVVERSKKYCYYLNKVYQDYIQLLDKDILKLDVAQEFDLALWLWGGIFDFNGNEQLYAIKKIAKHVCMNGYIIIDSIERIEQHDSGKYNNRRSWTTSHHYNILLNKYIADSQLIIKYSCDLGLKYISSMRYAACDEVKCLHILQK